MGKFASLIKIENTTFDTISNCGSIIRNFEKRPKPKEEVHEQTVGGYFSALSNVIYSDLINTVFRMGTDWQDSMDTYNLNDINLNSNPF